MKFNCAVVAVALIFKTAFSQETIEGTIYCDNYFEFYFNGELIAKDPLFFTPHQAVKVSFQWDGISDKTYAIMCQDFATESGYEYILKDEPNLGNGALLAEFSDGVKTSADWKVYVQTFGPTDASIASGCSPTNLEPCVVEDRGEPLDWTKPEFNASGWEAATTYTKDEAGWGIPPVGPYCGPATNPFTQLPMSIPKIQWSNPFAFFTGSIAYNWNDTVPTLENPWTYDEDNQGKPVQIKKREQCIVPRDYFRNSDAEFIWGTDLDRDNRILFRLDIAADDTKPSNPSTSIFCRIPPFSLILPGCS